MMQQQQQLLLLLLVDVDLIVVGEMNLIEHI
jgi:hypothetical protein